MSRQAAFSYISFLDLVCCGFGAAFLMFLIAVTSDPANRPEQRSESVLVLCRYRSGPRAEVGIEFRRPGSGSWERSTSVSGQATGFAATSETDSGAEGFVLLFAPDSGIWEFRPYLADFPREVEGNKPVRVILEVRSAKARAVRPATEASLVQPGDIGSTFQVQVGIEP